MTKPTAAEISSNVRNPNGASPTRRSKSHAWVVSVILICGALLAGWFRMNRGQEVSTALCRSAPFEVEWSATGYVECRQADVCAPQVGRVLSVGVREGDPVHAGQVLAQLASRPEEAGVQAESDASRAAAADARASQAALLEAQQTQQAQVERAKADSEAARDRYQEATASLDHDRQVIHPTAVAAGAEADAARADLLDLQEGARPEEIAQAKASAADAEAALVNAHAEWDRMVRLGGEGAVSKQSVDNAREQFLRAQAAHDHALAALTLLEQGPRPEQVAAAKARLRGAEGKLAASEGETASLEVDRRRVAECAADIRSSQAALAEAIAAGERLATLRQQSLAAEARSAQGAATVRQAQSGLADRTLLAPFEGFVGRRLADPGDMASPTQPLFTIVEAGRSWIAAEVDEQDLAPVRQGQPVTITAAAYPGREFSGTVERVGDEAIPQTEIRTGARIVRVRISLAPMLPVDRDLFKPGMETNIAGKTILAPNAILVPNDAILTDTTSQYVFVVDDGRTRQRRIQCGDMNGKETEILGGLRGGEIVIVSGKEGLVAGARVVAHRQD